MTPGTVLLVEDNPITRKLVRFTLEKQGFTLVEAPDAKRALELFPQHEIALVLQDLCLPDMDGFDLLAKLRALPGARDIPILVFSGMLSSQDEARMSSAGFDDFISKPVEPSRLVQIVRSYLPLTQGADGDAMGKGRRLIIADDDPVQRKLVGFRMEKVGFEVVLAADGTEALAQARRARPDAILSDVLMPGLDGFGLCLELRKDPALAKIPVVLTTNSYVEPTDQALARRAGANALVLRTPELREVLEALRASLSSQPPSAQLDLAPADDVEEEHNRRMLRQLERQVTLNARASQRCALLAAEMAVLKGISEALSNHEDIDEALRHTLAACFDAGGISLGTLYLKDGDSLRVISFGFSPDWSEGDLQDCFGERALLERAMRQQESMLVVDAGDATEGGRLLRRARAATALIVPIVHKDVIFGALLMLSRNGELQHDDRVKFGEAVAGQISQALALMHTFREKERSERAASEQTAILRSVLESIGDGVAVVDGDGKFIVWNSAASTIVSSMGSDRSLEPGTGDVQMFESDTVTPLPFERMPLLRAMRGEAVDGVEVFVRRAGAPDGQFLSTNGRPWRDEQGVARGAVAVFRDVTREKATQTQLLISDRMASVGMLASGVAHEINNPLTAVLANLELALLDVASYGGASELEGMLQDARHAADRVRQIVRDLKVFSRHEETRSGPVDIHKVLESSLRMAWNEIRHRARVQRSYGTVPLVHGAESRLGQVFLNLIVNAAQAIPEGKAHENEIRVVTCLDSGGRIAVEITDTGTGIPAEELGHLFRPFYTTKGPGIGTGLGLAISHRIITDLGGEVLVQSKVGQGTTFRVILPAARFAGLVAPPRVQWSSTAVRRARILVVDDDRMIAGVIRRTLAKQHDVVATVSAAEALDWIRSGESYDVILCDIMMPHMTGMDLYAALRTHAPAYVERMVFLTAGAFTQAARAFLDEVPNQRLEKPFDPQHLAALVNERIQ
jgi:CheY-like chemotaxis protein